MNFIFLSKINLVIAVKNIYFLSTIVYNLFYTQKSFLTFFSYFHILSQYFVKIYIEICFYITLTHDFNII